MIPPLRLFELYNAMSLHFREGSSYNYFKYRGKTNCSQATLEKRNDKYTFQSLAKKLRNEEEAKDFLVANFISGKTYIRNFSEDTFLKFMGYKEAYLYKFSEDLSETNVKNAVDLAISGNEKYLIFISLFNYTTNGYIVSKFNELYQDNILWETFRDKLLKVQPFIIDRFYISDPSVLRATIRELKKQEH